MNTTPADALQLISAQNLIQKAADEGFLISYSQLARWHREGLLPKPERTFKGRGQGSESFYPEWTFDQLIHLCQLQKEHRSLDDVTWALWWRGYEIDPTHWKKELFNAAAFVDRFVAEVRERDEGRWEIKEDILDRLPEFSSMPTKNKLFRQIRRRLRSDGMEALLYIVLKVVAGQFEGFEISEGGKSQQTIVFTAMGLHKINKDEPASNWLDPTSVEPALIDLSHLLKQPLCKFLGTANNDDIETAKREVSFLLKALTVLVPLLESQRGQHASGLSVAKDFAGISKPSIQAFWLMGWLLLKSSPEIKQRMEVLLASMSFLMQLHEGSNGA